MTNSELQFTLITYDISQEYTVRFHKMLGVLMCLAWLGLGLWLGLDYAFGFVLKGM